MGAAGSWCLLGRLPRQGLRAATDSLGGPPTPSVCGDKQGWPRWGAGERLGVAGRRPGAAGHRPRGHSRPLTQLHVFQTNTRPCTELGKAPCPGPRCLGHSFPSETQALAQPGGWSSQAEGAGAGGRLALTGGPEAAQAPARPLRRTSRPLFTTLC